MILVEEIRTGKNTKNEAGPPYGPPVAPLPAGAYIGLGFSLCCLCAGLLSPDFRKAQPGAFNLLFGIYGGWR